MSTKLESTQTKKGKYVYAVGKRKTSVATVRLYKGDGDITVNGKPVKDFVASKYDVDTIIAPLVLTDKRSQVDCTIQVRGGGSKSQAEAIRHGIARALVEEDIMLRPVLKKGGFLTRDSRRKERKKPGKHGARRSEQWSKR